MTAEDYINEYISGQEGSKSIPLDVALKAVMYARQEMEQYLWKDVEGDVLPEVDKEVIALEELDENEYKVLFAHRVPPDKMIRAAINGEYLEFDKVVKL